MAIYKLDKPVGISSAKFLNAFKKENNIKKAGYSGTLDPFASGLLIVGTDSDTKKLTDFLAADKEYIGTITFEYSTDTHDIDGEIIKTSDKEIKEEDVKEVIENNFLGKIMQIPPNHSAVHVNGVRAYVKARKGEKFTLEPKERTVHSFEIQKISEKEYSFKIKVSSGTYIRAIVRDLAEKLNTCATLKTLRRISIGEYKLED